MRCVGLTTRVRISGKMKELTADVERVTPAVGFPRQLKLGRRGWVFQMRNLPKPTQIYDSYITVTAMTSIWN